jgi:predicted nucleotidyltransferase
MKPTAEYKNALANFTAAIEEAPDVAAVYLYGSMAREEIVPGQSDIDFWVFVRDEAFADEAAFSKMLNGLAQAGACLAESNIPDFHAFCYYALSEANWLPAALVPNLQSDASSRLILGDDIRPRMSSSEASRYAHKTSYFADMRQHMFLPLTPYLQPVVLDEKAARQILGALKYVKYVAEAACAALAVYPGELEAINKLKELLPQVDTAVIKEIESFRIHYTAERDRDMLQVILLKALTFIESIHLQIRAF